ncbi:hypothetical protein [Streptomyces sp. NPDC088915]|uniref:hypothetical protein n=1 Tax=Streptomyces sp. NPDC088915 TaxID=3365912 RepID=UPI00380AF2AD
MTATATRTRHFYKCNCDVEPGPHTVPIQRVAVEPDASANARQLCAVLDGVWHDASLFYGPGVRMAIVCEEGDRSAAANAARYWAATRGFPVEPNDGFTTLRVVPESFAVPADERRPVYRYTA